jgi:CRISPR-associated exonuclease Cas4
LPKGEVIFEDASGRVETGPLYSARHNLSGKPDYLMKNQGHLIPVELKSTLAPKGGRPYESHLMQVAVYFVLVEDALGSRPPYGWINYRDCKVRVDNTEELQDRLFSILTEMRALIANGEAHRNHRHVRKCEKCSVANVCDERLVYS